MSKLTLVIGTKNLSSWSLRPWLFLRRNNVSFEEHFLELSEHGPSEAVLRHSPSGRVPFLRDGDIQVWDSLAICEYLAETRQIADAWPTDPAARALARSVACEMHAGFAALREELPFDATRRPEPKALSAQARADIARVVQIWRQLRQQHAGAGEWLFGRFGIADAMYAPVALRFHAYAVPLEAPEQAYVDTVLSCAAVREWIGGAFLGLGVRSAAALAPVSAPPANGSVVPAAAVRSAPPLAPVPAAPPRRDREPAPAAPAPHRAEPKPPGGRTAPSIASLTPALWKKATRDR